MSERYEARREKLRPKLDDMLADALLVSGETNVRWLTGFSGDSSWLVLGHERCFLVSDGRYATQIAEECPGLDVVIRKPEVKLHEAAAKAVRRAGVRRLGIETHILTFDQVQELQSALPGCALSPMRGTVPPLRGGVEELRAIKDADEIAQIREAVALAIDGFAHLRGSLTGEMSELDVARELQQKLWQLGAEGTSFETIVAADDRAALAHYRPSRNPIGHCSWLLVDWGAETRSRYKSDLTRMLVWQKPSKKLRTVYEIVLEAQRRAIDAIRPGVMCDAVDRAAREYIASCGYGAKFGHGLGHGIGLDIHEMPRLAPNSQTVLVPGMIVTVEPGIYLPGWGGVRIEDDVCITHDGCEVLSQSLAKNFESNLVD
jgi:Xaa-Pro aminopeptidase